MNESKGRRIGVKWFYKLERKYGRYAIHNLMYYIIIMYAVGFVISIFMPQIYYQYLSLNVDMILKGQVWRLVTFIIAPPDTSPIFILFALYLYYMIGNFLENVWGAFKFNVYFFFGVLLHIIAAFVVYFTWDSIVLLDTFYLNLSLFLAFACTNPNMEFLLFFILPVKVKWLGLLDGLLFLATIFNGLIMPLITGTPIYAGAVAALISLLNFLIFFVVTRDRRRISPKEIRRKMVYNAKIKEATKGSRHKCCICGQTEENPELTFRYCSKCEGNYEYCSEHLYTHQHIKKENQ